MGDSSDKKVRQLKHKINELTLVVNERKKSEKEVKEKLEKLHRTQKAMLYMVEDMNLTRKELQNEIEARKFSEEKVRRYAAQLQATNAELEAFSYSVSHDLRAPLRSMDGFSKAVLEDYQDKLDQQGRDYLTRIRKGAQRMGDLIDDLLQLSRVTRQELKITNVDLSLLVREAFSELCKSEPGRKVEISIEPDVVCKGDSRLLRIAIFNLINNAWKFTSKKDPATIEFDCIKKGSKRVYAIRDNGAGFDMRYKDKLFKAFQRLHSAAEYPGTGIGLVIVKRVISKHGGDVWIEGEENKGATVSFSLK